MTSTLDDTFNPTALSLPGTAVSANTSSKQAANSTPKPTKTTQSYPRIDFEPLYTELKALIGLSWAIYHDALTRFIRGELSAGEFGYLTDEFIYLSPATEHAHNSLICAIIHNTGRDSPEPGPASWVSATSDKTVGTSSSKPAITSDAGEQRLKTEIMALLPRDRKRLKGVISDKPEEDGSFVRRSGYEEYYNAGKIKAPEVAPTNAGSITRTNWELEIKKRYTQPLFAESLEFPDAATIYARMVPICYEESVGAGTSMNAAELVATAAEVYLKEFMGNIFNRTRSNGPRYENSAGEGIFTSKYRKRLLKEEEEVKAGRLSRTREDDLLPVELEEITKRRPLSINDIKLASRVGPNPWNGMPLLGMQVNEAPLDFEYDDWKAERDAIEAQMYTNGKLENGHVNGFTATATTAAAAGSNAMVDDDMDVDDDDYGWDGTGYAERDALGSLLEECLAVRA